MDLGGWSSDFLKQAEGLSFNDKFDILLEIGLSGVTEQGYTIVYGKSQINYKIEMQCSAE